MTHKLKYDILQHKESDFMQFVEYCPRCGDIGVVSDHKCVSCNCQTIETKYSLEEYFKDRTKIKQIIIELYKNSSEFSEELFNARENKMRQKMYGSMSKEEKNVLKDIEVIPDKNVVKCPKCGSTAVSTGAKGFSIVTGFIGSGQTVNRCGNCGHKWRPKG